MCSETEHTHIKVSPLASAIYVRFDFSEPPFEIKIPKLTRKERLYIDSHLPCKPGWCPKDFELDPNDVESYRQVYRFLPAYGELLV